MAIKAQGSKLFIGTGSGSAKTVTAITQAFRAMITSAAHGLVVGDRVTFAAVVGMTQINGLTGTILARDVNTFVVDIDTRAFTTYTSGGTATPVTWTQIAGVDSFDWQDGEGADIEVTDLDSTAKEFLTGLQDPGTFAVTLNVKTADPGQGACVTAKASGLTKDFKLELPNGATRTFAGQVKGMPESGGVDAKLSGSMNIRISGSVVRA